MITILEDELVSIQGGKKSEKEIVASEEYNEIMEALKVLNKHFGSYIVAGYTKEDGMSLVYNRANETKRGDSKMLDTMRGEGKHSEKEIRKMSRGAETSSIIMNILIEAEEEYGIKKEAIMQTYTKALEIIENLSSKDIKEAAQKLRQANSVEEGVEVTKVLMEKAENPKKVRYTNNYEINNKFNKLDEMFNGGDLDKAIKDLKGSIDPQDVLSVLGKLYNATVVLGIIKVGEDGEPDDEKSSVQYILQDNLKELAKKSDRDFEAIKISAAGCVAMSIMGQLSEEYGLRKGFWVDYIKKF